MKAGSPTRLPVGHVVVREPLPYLDSWVNERSLELGQLFVSPSVEGLGVGLCLTRNALDWASERDLNTILAVLDMTPRAIEFYERLGFARIGWFQGFDGGNTVMRYDHTPSSGFES